MELSNEEKAILNGEKGETLQKVLKSVVNYGDLFGAQRLVSLTNNSHSVLSMGVGLFTPFYTMLDEIVEEGLKMDSFTVDPYPMDFKNIKSNFFQKMVFRILYKSQNHLDILLQKLGLQENGYTCTCYLPEVGNIPKQDDILAWSESSAVVFANSVLGARTNRNSAGIDILMGIIRKTPEFDLLTDEGRKATWIINLKTETLPDAQLLGSAIGMKVMEDVPYIVGLDKFLGNELNDENLAYLKDMGAAAASNGAVGLYHVENLTPEASKYGKSIIDNAPGKYIIDEQELDRVFNNYPNIWKNTEAKPKKCLIGCPHLSLGQLYEWSKTIINELDGGKVSLETVLLAAPDVINKFMSDSSVYKSLTDTGTKLSSTCPLTFMANPLCKQIPIVTNSNKLRTYTSARFFMDHDILKIIKTGNLPKEN